MKTLVIAEHDNTTLSPATLHVVAAAQKLGSIDILVAGSACAAVAQAAAKIAGIGKVWCADTPHLGAQLAETVAPLVAQLAKDYSHVLAAATSNGKNILPRAAALLDVAPVSDILSVESPDTFTRPIYAGNAVATVQCLETIKLGTVRPTAFPLAPATGGNAEIAPVASIPADAGLSKFISRTAAKNERPELTAAKIVVSGGRGVGSAENFKAMIETLADAFGAAVGASRAAVDSGYAPNDFQVGQTGKIVAPELYVAVGISGAIQHLAGMKDSKIIVAINKDSDAPIFQVADFGLVGDLFQIVPELVKMLPAVRNAA